MGIDPNESFIEEVDIELRRAQVQTNVARSSLAAEYPRKQRGAERVEGGQEYSVEIDKKHLKWNNQMDVVLIDSLLDQMLKGQKIGGSFTSSAYRAASNAVSTKFSIHCDSNHVWAAYLEAKHKASHFRHAPIQNFQNLCQLFKKD
ncbi:hypothetical protein CsSME_00012608 [Camellia sinensis var. sinensis]